MINRSVFGSISQSKLARRGVMFAGACLLTLVPIYSSLADTTFTDSPKAIVDEVWQIINTEYVDGTFNHSDWQKTRTQLLQRKYNNRQEAYMAIRASLDRLGDKYTRFMNPQEFQLLNTATSGEVAGVGIKMEANPRTQQLVVVATVKNSPAAKAGIKPGDAIIAIDGKPTLNISLDGAIALIRGETGKSIVVKISRGKMKPFDIPLTRASLEVASVFTRVKQEGKLKVGYIRLLEFSSNSASQMETAIKDLNRQKVNAYVLDLRDNPGGLVHICIQMARMWLDNGTIVKTVDRQGNSEVFQAYGESLTRLPLAVLVDGNSASASEILAAALKDNHRATIVGAQTFGKALVQAVHPLADGSGMAVTVAHYYTPNGTDIGHIGVTPDVKLELTKVEQEKLEYYPALVASKRDPQYQRAITILKK